MVLAYPLELKLGPLTITGFGLTMALAFAVGAWLIDRELRRRGFAPDFSGDMIIGGLIGGILGAKLWYAGLHGVETLFQRSGLVFYGGFLGGTLGVFINGWRRRVPWRWTLHLSAPVLAAGYAVGRVGCFVVGDDYGRATDLPWGVAFPEGAPPSTAGIMERSFGLPIPDGASAETLLAVHPTQLYEVAIIMVAFTFLWRWRARAGGTGWLFGAYLMMAGAERFFVEFFRAKDDSQFLPGITLAQAMALILVLLGIYLYRRWKPMPELPPGDWLMNGSGASKAS
jgi:phosphatidylglycerol:prolipoprotein diacylglycerol transferase